MHEADDTYSIRSTWSCYWLDQFLTLALNILILSTFYISMDLSTNYFAHFSGCSASFVCSCHSILECCVTFSGVKLSVRSFVLFLRFHPVLTFIAFSFSCIISAAWGIFKHYSFLVSLSHNKRWDFQLLQLTFERVLSTCAFISLYIYTHTFFIRNLYPTLYLIIIIIHYLITLEIQ